MDEEQNNNQQDIAEKVGQDVNDTKDMVKDGTNLAKDIGTGNILGAVKDSFSLLKNKKFRRILIIAILIPIVVIIMIAASVFSVFDTIGNTVQEVLSGIIDFFTFEKDADGKVTDGAIVINDEQIEAIITAIESTGVDLDDLALMGDIDYESEDLEAEKEKALKKYIKKFYEAQAMTQTFYTNLDTIFDINKTYGKIYVYRMNEGDTKELLTYMDYDEMVRYANNGNKGAIQDYFSVDAEGKLVIPYWTITTINGSSTVQIGLKSIDYKNSISQYTTPMNFFLYLGMITKNPEFVSAAVDLVKDSRIEITVLDTTNKSVETEVYTYTRNTKGSVSSGGIIVDAGDVENKKKTTITTVESVIPSVKVTYVKTWFCEQNVEYSIKDTTPYISEPDIRNSSNDETLKDDSEPADPPEGSTVKWNTDKEKTTTVEITGTTFEESLRGDVIDKTGNRGDGKTSFIGLLDESFKIPNSSRKEKAGPDLVSNAEWFFYLLQKDSSLQNIEQVMRYVMYKYTGEDYGVSDLNFSIFDIRDFNSVSGIGYLKSFIRYFEGTKEEGDMYVVYEDSGGNRTVGYGINIEAKAVKFLDRGIDTSTIKAGDLLEKEIVDDIEDEILEEMKQQVEAATSGLDLKSYQIIALVSRYYNCGNILGFKDAYNDYWTEDDDEYGVSENSTMYEHLLYKNYMSTPIRDNKGNTLAGLVKRRKAEWLLFKTGYNIASGNFVAEGGEIIEWAETIHTYMEENGYCYCVYDSNSGEECVHLARGSHYLSSTFEGSKGNSTIQKTCCATFVSWVLQEAGYLEENECIHGANNLASFLASEKGFIKVPKEELQPGDIVVCSGHVEIYAGDNQVYNAGSGSAIRSAAPSSKSNLSKCLYGLRAPY